MGYVSPGVCFLVSPPEILRVQSAAEALNASFKSKSAVWIRSVNLFSQGQLSIGLQLKDGTHCLAESSAA